MGYWWLSNNKSPPPTHTTSFLPCDVLLHLGTMLFIKCVSSSFCFQTPHFLQPPATGESSWVLHHQVLLFLTLSWTSRNTPFITAPLVPSFSAPDICPIRIPEEMTSLNSSYKKFFSPVVLGLGMIIISVVSTYHKTEAPIPTSYHKLCVRGQSRCSHSSTLAYWLTLLSIGVPYPGYQLCCSLLLIAEGCLYHKW